MFTLKTVVGTRFDYCNSLLYGVSWAKLNTLQRVQNSLARIVLTSDIRSNAKQNLADLHWLPVRSRIQFKIALLTLKSITKHRPTYLSDLLQFRTSSRNPAPATIACFTMLGRKLFLQCVSIACYAERCTSYRKYVRLSVRLSVCLSVTRWHCVKTTHATIMRSPLEDSPMTLVS